MGLNGLCLTELKGRGNNTAIFSLIDAVMLKALPVSHPEKLMQVAQSGGATSFSNPPWEEIRDHQDEFDAVLAYGQTQFNLAVLSAFFGGLGLLLATIGPLRHDLVRRRAAPERDRRQARVGHGDNARVVTAPGGVSVRPRA